MIMPDPNTMDWFYSTLAQIFAAIFALLGVFVIYRLQDQRSKIKEAINDALDIIGSRLHTTLGRRTISHVVKYLKGEIKVRKDKGKELAAQERENLSLIEEVTDKIIDLLNGEQWVKRLIVAPFVSMFVIMTLSIFLLAFHRI